MKKAKGPYERKVTIGLPRDTEYLGHLEETGHLILETLRPVNPDLNRDVREVIHKCCDDIKDILKVHNTPIHPGVDMMEPLLDAFQSSMDISYLMEAMKYAPDSHNRLIKGSFPTLRVAFKEADKKVGSAFTEED